MATKKTDLARIGGFLAFAALFISGVLFLVNAIASLFEGGVDGGLLLTIASWAFLISVIISGFIFLQTTKFKNRTVWTILFWVFVILAILGQLNLFA